VRESVKVYQNIIPTDLPDTHLRWVGPEPEPEPEPEPDFSFYLVNIKPQFQLKPDYLIKIFVNPKG
jgi:hypothetical protein